MPENLPPDHCNACIAGKAGQHEAKGQEIGVFAYDRETFRECGLCYCRIVRLLHADVSNMKRVGKYVGETFDEFMAEILIEQKSRA